MATPKPYQIYLADVAFDDTNEAKYRPALVMIPGTGKTRIYKITTQYSTKSDAIKAVYYPILEWQKAGLDRQSYVDVHKTYTVPTKRLTERKLRGVLSDVDAARLMAFILNHQNEIKRLQ